MEHDLKEKSVVSGSKNFEFGIAVAPTLKLTFDYPQAYRTSNAVDQLMNLQDRMLYAMQYFHGSQASAQQALRAMALL
jgi:hypothetical protein